MIAIKNSYNHDEQQLKIGTIMLEELEKLLQKLKINKSAGPDDLPAYFLKELAEEIAPTLTAIYTQSLHTSSLPQD